LVQTSSGVFQSVNDRSLKVIVANSGQPGIFVLLGQPIDLQLFDPAKVKQEGSIHLFLVYSPELDRYAALQVGAKRYPIKGSFTLLIKLPAYSVRLSVDNNNPLATIVLDSRPPANAPSNTSSALLAFRGTQLVANETGLKVALLEANQLSSQFRGVIDPYLLTEQGLSLKGTAVENSPIGLEIASPKNACLNPGTVFIDEKDLGSIRNLKREESLKELERLISASPADDPLKGVLLLRIENTQMIGLDYTSGVIKIVRTLGRPGKQVVCAIRVIPLQE
jgi:hypothetical protein